MKEQNRIWVLIGRKLSGEASEEEVRELYELLKDNPDQGFYLQLLGGFWEKDKKKTPEAEDKVFQRIRSRIKKKKADRDWEQDTRALLQSQHSTRSFFTDSFLKRMAMLGNYFKFTWRVLFRNKAFSFINIGGLSIGMAIAIVILLLIQHELSFDQFHTKKDRIYLLYNRAVTDGKIESWPITPMVLGPVLKMDYPEAQTVVRVNWVAAFILKTGDKKIQAQGYLTDPGFLTMFDFPLLKGNAHTALSTARSIVITEKLSKKMFGAEDAMGKIIRIDSNALFTVTGVLKNFPKNTQFAGDYLVPFSYMKEVGWENPNWGENSIVHTYVLLKEGVSEKTANNRFRNIIHSHANEIKNQVFLHPLRKWRLWSRFENGKITGGNIEYVRMFGFTAAFVLLIACINYMNMSTARSVNRAREVGIRKVVGAGKGSLVGQFLWESILFAFLACILALIIVQPGLRWFNHAADNDLSIPYTNPKFWLFMMGFVLFTGVLSGSYPAFYLSGFKPIHVMKGIFKGANALVTPRKVLVVFQFTIAIALIICTIVIYRQIVYGQQRDAGYDQNNLVYVYVKGDMLKNYVPISTELMKSKAITSITRTNSPITDTWRWEDKFEWEGKKPGTRYEFGGFNTEQDFIKTMGLRLVKGRDIDIRKYPGDSTAILLNESAEKAMGFANPIGQQLKNGDERWHVVGVVKNFVSVWPYQPDFPVLIQGPGFKNMFGTLTFRLNASNSTKKNLSDIAAVFKKYNPDYPFEYYFVDDSYAQKFMGEKFMVTLSAVFAGLTILISCLGLFALATYMAENRIKEIGIRKVLGASVGRIATLLSKDFLKLVIISFVIASPLAWWAMNAWLRDYAYRISLSWWIFAVTGVISIVIAVTTVGFQAIKAALSNPVKSLRSE